jgi:hypothetical protein
MHDPDRGGSRTPEHAQQARLARTVAADETDLVAGADRQALARVSASGKADM